LPLVYKHFVRNERFTPENTILNHYSKEYILYKIENISEKYQPYKRMFGKSLVRKWDKKDKSRIFDEETNFIEDYFMMLAQDNSHITFKLRQAINFLSNDLYYKRREKFELTISYLSKQLEKKSKLKDKELIDILPPAFFKVDVEFKDLDTFNQLSSGEKQRVYSISTLIYHLNNLSSVSPVHSVCKYNRVNIIFDELELYFHPELQRNLINDILESIKKIDLKDIDSVNILLITHSPFILSDIPHSNILFLEKNGEPLQNRENIKTFGGNIHELLAHSFFLEKGFIGEFAKNKIQNIIDFLNPDSEEKKQKSNLSQVTVLKEIQIIGEPFLKEKLLEMYFSKYENERNNRIAKLENELNQLKNV
jgi:uncharacterized damage-inducible protein DinB